MSYAEVNLWGRRIGGVTWDAEREIANFEYEPAFVESHIEVAPFVMPLSSTIYAFPALPRKTFHGLPGMLADSLPDKFGNALIDAWLAKEGRSPENFNPVERLCYIGKRGMGALEFQPAKGPNQDAGSNNIQVESLVRLASEILTKKKSLQTSFSSSTRERALKEILRVGTSAGGARAKAVIAWNPKANEVRSGQMPADKGFTYWILKFDGVHGNMDKDLDSSRGYGLIEYGYYKMALAAGLQMTECRLLKEHGRNHFMTKRFDRTDSGKKIFMQSLAALAHYDFNQAGAYSYEQAIQAIRRLGLPMESVEQQFRRAAFNVMARNQDDHVKNIAFLMDREGVWSLAPAFDVIYSYNPSGDWTKFHQTSLNGKRDELKKNDFIQLANNASMKRGRAIEILREVQDAVSDWKKYAAEAGVPEETAERIGNTHRV